MAATAPKPSFTRFMKPTTAIPDAELTPAQVEKNQEEMTKWLASREKDAKIVLKEAMNRNIIFVGKTRSGKSTALEVLKDPNTFVEPASIFSETVDPQINHFTVEVEDDARNKFNFNISIIDTPGLFEMKGGSEARDIETLENLILKCMQAEITKIHMIFFVVAQTGAVNPHDVESLAHFIKLFAGAENHIHVLVTKSEGLTPEHKIKIQTEFKNAPGLRDLLKQVNDIHFMGAVEKQLYDRGFVDTFKSSFASTCQMREELFGHIFAADAPFELNAIGMSDTVRAKASALFESLKLKFASLPLANPAAFKADCKRLNGWLPVLPLSLRTEMKTWLVPAGQHIEELERQAETAASSSTPQ